MERAYAAATGTNDEPSHTTQDAASATETKQPQRSNGEELTKTIATTITKTTTDGQGNTLQVVVPIVLGPTDVSTGAIVTSTLDSRASSTGGPASTAASPSATASDTKPESTQDATSTAAADSQETQSPANGNGSPFENMQAGAERWLVSISMLGLGVLTTVSMWW